MEDIEIIPIPNNENQDIIKVKERYVPFHHRSRLKKCSRGGHLSIQIHLNRIPSNIVQNFETIEKIELNSLALSGEDENQPRPVLVGLPKRRPRNYELPMESKITLRQV